MSSSSSDAATAVASPAGEDEARPLDLEGSIEEVSTCQRRVKVTVPRADIDRYRDDAIGELMPSALLPGFRPAPGRGPPRGDMCYSCWLKMDTFLKCTDFIIAGVAGD